jgi:hypothetical protein
MTQNNLQSEVCQKHSVSAARGALLHAYQVQLFIRRARSNEDNSDRRQCLGRLLESIEHIAAGLENLDGSVGGRQ